MSLERWLADLIPGGAWWVEDPALPQLWLGCDSSGLAQEFHVPQGSQKENKDNKRKKIYEWVTNLTGTRNTSAKVFIII